MPRSNAAQARPARGTALVIPHVQRARRLPAQPAPRLVHRKCVFRSIPSTGVQNAQKNVPVSSVVVHGKEIAPLRVLRSASHFAHEAITHQPYEAGAGCPGGKSNDGCDLTGQLALAA